MNWKYAMGISALTGMLNLAGCSTDSAVDDWKSLPAHPLAGEDVKLTLNGDTAEGSVSLTARSATEGTLTLHDVVFGCEEIAMDVSLSRRTDGTYRLDGQTGLKDIPVTETREDRTLFLVTAGGEISSDGKASIRLSTALTTESLGGMSRAYRLTRERTRDADGDGWKKAPALLCWKAEGEHARTARAACRVMQRCLPRFLTELLHEVTLHPDGNVTGSYGGRLPGTEGMDGCGMDRFLWWVEHTAELPDGADRYSPLNISWKPLPKHVAFWYVKNDRLYVMPHMHRLLRYLTGGTDMESLLTWFAGLGIDTTDAQVLEAIPMLSQWLKRGIPFKYARQENGKGVKVWLDKETAAPLMQLFLPLLALHEDRFPEPLRFDGKWADLPEVWRHTTDFRLTFFFDTEDFINVLPWEKNEQDIIL